MDPPRRFHPAGRGYSWFPGKPGARRGGEVSAPPNFASSPAGSGQKEYVKPVVNARSILFRTWFASVLVLFFLSGAPASAQQPGLAVTQNGHKVVRAVRITAAIKLDGELSEGAWREAEPADHFVQSEPLEGTQATEDTEVKILYNDDNLYIGVHCHDKEPGRILTNSLKKDFAPKDSDSFEIILDTFQDRRNGFLFTTNPHGAKRDAQVTDEGRNINPDWDTVWDVRTQMDGDGWTAEIVIPFKSLSLDQNRVEQLWGINFGRRIRRKNEVVYWAPIPRLYDITRLSLAGELQGVENIERGRNLRLKPFVVADLTKFAHNDYVIKKAKEGLDAKYSVTPSLTLDVTLNTDFSQVEVDEQQVNLTRFKLFFPEKREFFLENSGIFQFGDVPFELGPNHSKETQLFFSRRIGLSESGEPQPIWGGVRLSGEAGKFGIGILDMQTKGTGTRPGSNFLVTRFKRNILSNSDFGAIFINRQASEGKDFNRTLGADANFRFGQDFTVNGYLAKTMTDGLDGHDRAGKVSAQWRDRVKRFQVVYSDLEDNFNPEVGFTQRTGARILRNRDDLYWRPWKKSIIRELNPHYLITYYMDQKNRTVTKELHYAFIQIFFQNGASLEFHYDPIFDRLDRPFRIRQGITLPAGDYHYASWVLELGSNQSRTLAGTMQFKKGGYYSGHITSLDATGTLRPNFRFSVEAGISRNDVTLREGSFVADLARLRVNYYFSTRMFLSALVQYNNDQKQVSSNIRFNFIHHPLSDLFLVLNEQRDVSGARRTDRGVSVKYTHMLPF